MSKRTSYTYVLLRYRHDPLAGEFANVGVVLHAPSDNFLGVRVRRTMGRLGKIFPGISKSDLTSSLSVIERSVRQMAPTNQVPLFRSDLTDAAKFAAKALPPDDSSYIWGPLQAGLTDDPARTLDGLYDRFVGRFDDEPSVRRDDDSVWQPVRERLSARKLLDRLTPKTIVSPLDEVQFDSAWKNGAWHCYQPLSFDLSTAEGIRDKAARWSGHMLGASKSTENVKPHFIVGAPTDESLRSDYERAIHLLRASALDPKVYEENEVDTLVEKMAAEMSSSRSKNQ